MKHISGPKMDPKKVNDFKKARPDRHRIDSLSAPPADDTMPSDPKAKSRRLPYSGNAPYLGERWK